MLNEIVFYGVVGALVGSIAVQWLWVICVGWWCFATRSDLSKVWWLPEKMDFIKDTSFTSTVSAALSMVVIYTIMVGLCSALLLYAGIDTCGIYLTIPTLIVLAAILSRFGADIAKGLRYSAKSGKLDEIESLKERLSQLENNK